MVRCPPVKLHQCLLTLFIFVVFFSSKKPIPYERTYWGTKQKNTKIKGKKKFILCFFKSFLCMHGTCDLCPQSGGIFYRLDLFLICRINIVWKQGLLMASQKFRGHISFFCLFVVVLFYFHFTSFVFV